MTLTLGKWFPEMEFANHHGGCHLGEDQAGWHGSLQGTAAWRDIDEKKELCYQHEAS